MTKETPDCSPREEISPVACYTGSHTIGFLTPNAKLKVGEFLYTMPPLRQLSDQDIMDCWFSLPEAESIAQQQIAFARAIMRLNKG